MKRIYLTGLVCCLALFTVLNSCSEEEKEKIFIRIAQPGIPRVSISVVNNSITSTSVTVNGTATTDNDDVITERGFEITSSNPDCEGRFVRIQHYRSSGNGTFSFEITGLYPGKHYLVKAYAINGAGNGFSESIGFNTLAKPVITTDFITVISDTDVSVSGSVSKIHNSDIDERGICYSTAPSPTADGLRIVSSGAQVGIFTSELHNLEPGESYYVRTYISIYSDDGWGGTVFFYGNEMTFIAGGK